MRLFNNPLTAILSINLLTLSSSIYSQPPEFVEQKFHFPATSEQILVADFNGDSRKDLLVVLDKQLRVYFQRADGFDFEEGFDELDFTNQSVGWDVSENYQNGATSIITLLNGDRALSWQANGETFNEPQLISSNLNGFLSKGLNRLHFSRDINNDGLEDLIIPGPGQLQIHMNAGAGMYQPPLNILSDFRIRTTLESSRLDRRVGQAIRIPLMELRDINSDGLDDLISRTDEKLDVFLANQSENAYFPEAPSYSLNIAEIEERLGEFDIDNVDFSNLTGVLALTHEELLEDIDGDGIDDLLLREGDKVTLFGGTQAGMNFDQPRQVLRSGGNVLSTFLHDENEDGLKDLWLWRVEPISVGDIFVWLALSGSIAVDAFVYPNQGERFARRPTRKLTVDLKFPSVIRLTSNFRELEDEISAQNDGVTLLSTIADFNNPSDNQDLVALLNNQLAIFLNSIEPTTTETEFLGSLGYSRDRDSYQIDIRDILERAARDANRVQSSIQNLDADISIPIPADYQVSDLLTAKINTDDVDDIFVFTHHESSQITGLLLLSTDSL